MGIPFTILMGFLLTMTMGILFTITIGIQLTIYTSSARATMTYRGITASATLTVNNKGELVNFVAQRYFTLDDQYSLETWSTPLKEYREINGYKLPVKGEGIWHLSSGDFPYIRLEIVDIQYNLHKGN